MIDDTIVKKPRRKIGGIPKLHGANRPTELLFFDTETFVIDLPHDTVKFPMRLGVAIYVKLNKDLSLNKRVILSFYTSDEFITILKTYCKARRKLYVFAHNIRFDIMVLNLPLELSKHGIKSNIPIISERLFIWNVPINKAHALFIDTANFQIISIEQIGKDLGYPKQKVDFTTVSDSDLLTYCKRDVEIIEMFVLEYVRFINANNLGTFKTTIASQAFTAWRTRFMRKTCVIHNDENVLKLERNAYHGGRVECFKMWDLPEQDYYYLDVNSMYPYVMKNSNVPTRLLYSVDNPTLDKFSKYLKAHYVIADVTVNTDIAAYPLLRNSKLLFPTGSYRTTLHHKELSYALRHNHITQVHRVALYDYGCIFTDYIDFFYKIKTDSKLSNNVSWYIIAKYFQNTLYGKFGQTGIIQEITQGDYEQTIERYTGNKLGTDHYETTLNWFGTKVSEKREGESSFSVPCAAGAITANARMLLLDYIERAKWTNTYYCDTDSLIVNSNGYRHLTDYLDNSELGLLKLEKQSQYVSIYGPKDYEFGGDIRHKGISTKAVQENTNSWRVLQFGGINPWFNVGTNVEPTAKYITKTRKHSYSKGLVNTDNGTVTPIVLSE